MRSVDGKTHAPAMAEYQEHLAAMIHKTDTYFIAGTANTAGATAAATGSSGGLSAEEMQAAMRSVEDETDAAAAAALEQENAAELAEFTVEPAARVSAHALLHGLLLQCSVCRSTIQ